MFEAATRLRFRFETPMGVLQVEDLWDLPLTSVKGANLDDIARSLHRQLKNDDNVSFVKTESKSDPVIQAKFDLVKHIIDVRLVENAAARKKQDDAAQRQKILAIMADREDDNLKNLPVEELRKLLADFDK